MICQWLPPVTEGSSRIDFDKGTRQRHLEDNWKVRSSSSLAWVWVNSHLSDSPNGMSSRVDQEKWCVVWQLTSRLRSARKAHRRESSSHSLSHTHKNQPKRRSRTLITIISPVLSSHCRFPPSNNCQTFHQSDQCSTAAPHLQHTCRAARCRRDQALEQGH